LGADAAQAVLDFMSAPAQTALKERHGMEAAQA
jgi:molybdate transport system substrate-binding protein